MDIQNYEYLPIEPQSNLKPFSTGTPGNFQGGEKDFHYLNKISPQLGKLAFQDFFLL